MFDVYAVRVVDGEKQRFFIERCDNIEWAKHVANSCVCGNANYAYVKEPGYGTIFFIRPPYHYQEITMPPLTPEQELQRSKQPKGLFRDDEGDQKRPFLT